MIQAPQASRETRQVTAGPSSTFVNPGLARPKESNLSQLAGALSAINTNLQPVFKREFDAQAQRDIAQAQAEIQQKSVDSQQTFAELVRSGQIPLGANPWVRREVNGWLGSEVARETTQRLAAEWAEAPERNSTDPMAADIWWRQRMSGAQSELGLDPGSTFGMGFMSSAERQIQAIGSRHTSEVIQRNAERLAEGIQSETFNGLRNAAAVRPEDVPGHARDALRFAIDAGTSKGMSEIEARSVGFRGILTGLTAEAHNGDLDLAFSMLEGLDASEDPYTGADSLGESNEFGPAIAQKRQELNNIAAQRRAAETRALQQNLNSNWGRILDQTALDFHAGVSPTELLGRIEQINQMVEQGLLEPKAAFEYQGIIRALASSYEIDVSTLRGTQGWNLDAHNLLMSGQLTADQMRSLIENPNTSRDMRQMLLSSMGSLIQGNQSQGYSTSREELRAFSGILLDSGSMDEEGLQRLQFDVMRSLNEFRTANPQATESEIRTYFSNLMGTVFGHQWENRADMRERIQQKNQEHWEAEQARNAEATRRLESLRDYVRDPGMFNVNVGRAAELPYTRPSDTPFHNLLIPAYRRMRQAIENSTATMGRVPESVSDDMALLDILNQQITTAMNNHYSSNGVAPGVPSLTGVMTGSWLPDDQRFAMRTHLRNLDARFGRTLSSSNVLNPTEVAALYDFILNDMRIRLSHFIPPEASP